MNNIMLIVDDAEINRAILKILFHKEYEIMEAESGEEALEVLERCQGSIDIVLLDLVMPGTTGFEILERRAQLDYFKNVPVVVITSSGSIQDQIRAFKLGANDFVQKPFEPEVVISRVNNVMSANRRMLSIELEAKRLKMKSELDEMTGLYNKPTTELFANETLKNSRNHLDAMMVIDIDHFKAVNDTSGHQAGDRVIKIIADLINSRFRKTDIVGRVGGDEFCVVMVDVPSMEIVQAKAAELIQIMRYKPNLAIPDYVTLSIGVAENGREETTYPALFQKADRALYLAKENGRARYQQYGVEPTRAEDDSRPALLLLSNNRSVCSMVGALAPAHLRVIEALDLEAAEHLNEADAQQLALTFVDVSDLEHGAEAYWEKVRGLPWVKMENTFAICKEGDTQQYQIALANGVSDLFTVPLEDASFRHRTMRQLVKRGVLKAFGDEAALNPFGFSMGIS